MKIKHVPNWSVVKLPDGRFCTVTNKTEKRGKPIAQFADSSQDTYLDSDEIEVEVLLYPAQLAKAHLLSLEPSQDD
jgi:hypothetical protein